MMADRKGHEEMLGQVRAALGRPAGAPVLPVPATARIAPREAGPGPAELALLFAEIDKLGGHTRTVSGAAGLAAALAEMVETEQIHRAALWRSPDVQALGLAAVLEQLGVQVVPDAATKDDIAACELGVTGVDAALPETGTLYLRGGPQRGRMISLLPRVHLALLRPSALRPDLHHVLADARAERYGVFITGPSRTSDIELTLTIGVHGPKALYVWLLVDEEGRAELPAAE